MRKIILIFTFLLLIVLLCACTGSAVDVLPEGFSQENREGGKSFSDVNIKSVSADDKDGITEVRISFCTGSDLTYSGEVALSGLPAYKIEWLNDYYALRISVENVVFTDFERGIHDTSDEFSGVFYDDYSGSIMIQLAHDCAYSVAEDKSELTVRLLPLDKQYGHDDYAYCVTANLSDYEQMRIWQRDESLSPTLTRDGRIILISKPFEEKGEADALKTALADKYPYFSHAFSVIAKYYDELPMYDEAFDYALSYSFIPVREGDYTVEIPDGYYLSKTENGLLYEKFITKAGATHSEIYLNENGMVRQFTDFEFESIEDVKVSPDGRRIAVLENSQSGSHLYIFDLTSGELLYDLSDAGFGKRIGSFIWNETGSAVYAISGTDGISLHMYDFTMKDETKRHSIIYSKDIDEGSLCICRGKLYFTVTDEAESSVFALVPEVGTVKKVCAGGSIDISGDYAAISTANTVADSDGYEFCVLNLQTGERTMIENSFPIYDFAWSDDGRYIYYVDNRFAGQDTDESDTTQAADEYPCTIYRYDVNAQNNEKLCDTCSLSRFYASEKALYLMCCGTKDDIVTFAATYVVER